VRCTLDWDFISYGRCSDSPEETVSVPRISENIFILISKFEIGCEVVGRTSYGPTTKNNRVSNGNDR
jgi:7,8-dihydro-6-hydroxymethylpterin-pyrophosphokinase